MVDAEALAVKLEGLAALRRIDAEIFEAVIDEAMLAARVLGQEAVDALVGIAHGRAGKVQEVLVLLQAGVSVREQEAQQVMPEQLFQGGCGVAGQE